jgi:hypothetical protein
MADKFEGAVKEQIFARIDKLQPDSKAAWGRLNATSMLSHLNDAFRISLGMRDVKDKSNFFTRYIKFPIAVYVLPAWPKGSRTAAEMNPLQAGSKPRDFYTEAEFLKKMIDIFNERDEAKIKPHPMFGKLNKQQWHDLFVKHIDHHFKQFGV